MPKTILLFLLIFAGNLYAQAVNITFYTEKEYKSKSGEIQHDADKQATVFTPKGNAAPVYISLDFTDLSAIKAKYRIELQVKKKTAGGEEYAYSQEMGIPRKLGGGKIKSSFTPGDYIARLVDKENESDVYGSATFSVSAANKPDYKNNNTMVACKSVDDDWNPVGETKTIKAGSCISFLFKASKSGDKIMYYAMIWSIRRVKDDGSEEYVNDLQQMVQDGGWRYVSTDNVCEFSKPGKYRVYLYDKATSDSMHNAGDDQYYGKMEFTVQ